MEKKGQRLFALATAVLLLGAFAVSSVLLWYEFSDKLYSSSSAVFREGVETGVQEAAGYYAEVDQSLPGAERYCAIKAACNGANWLNYHDRNATGYMAVIRAEAYVTNGETRYRNVSVVAKSGNYLLLPYEDENGYPAGYAVLDIDGFFGDETRALAFIEALMNDTRLWQTDEIRITGLLDSEGFITPSRIEYQAVGETTVLFSGEALSGEVTVSASGDAVLLCQLCQGDYGTAEHYVNSMSARLPDIRAAETELDWYIEHSFGEDYYPVYTNYRRTHYIEKFANHAVISQNAATGEALILVCTARYNNQSVVFENNWGYFALLFGFFAFAAVTLIVINRRFFTFGGKSAEISG